ncbi:hypothetical protein HU200_061950 [Digitaria exilis]|uniref:Bifunctional inhibitor/plant lipid transfer protein/seed storage helical domain-containing protein n=1 Tax=Digitaria exilis TaxID=1010633 RepID=A0A835A6X4_9POAL|nr:hypothetical protein HU200_061950 [Digitaria exilis]
MRPPPINAGRPPTSFTLASPPFLHSHLASPPRAYPEFQTAGGRRKSIQPSSMARWWWCLSVAVWCAATAAVAQSPPAADPLQAKCSADFGKLTDCMDYATGHAGSPSSQCCADAADTQKARPQCLCYIIQQVRSGRNEVQSLGLRFDRLLALPKACNLANANVTLCIITPSTSAGDTTAGTSSGFRLEAGFRGSVALAVLSAVLSSVF